MTFNNSACERPARRGFDLERSHMTKHGCGAPAAAGRTNRHSARADLSLVVFAGLLALLAAKFVRPVYDLRASRRYSADPQPYDNRIVRTLSSMR